MARRDDNVPFGLLFEESVPIGDPPNAPLDYDEREGISYMRAADGSRVPFVESEGVEFETETKMRREQTDASEPSRLAATITFTMQPETGDADVNGQEGIATNPPVRSGFDTFTAVRRESTD